MLDFFEITTRRKNKNLTEIKPKFSLKRPSKDLMVKGGKFYAIWDEEKGLWSTNEFDAVRLIDKALNKYINEKGIILDANTVALYCWDTETGTIDKFKRFCEKQWVGKEFHPLDEQLTFANSECKREDYASKKLSYSLIEGPYDNWDRLVGTLYSPEERHKIEWAIGAIVSGDSRWIQKFMVLYGSAGTGKSTIINVIEQLFKGYCATFDARALGSSNASFALEAFRDNPLVAIQHDGDLSRIEDNTRLNSIVSHEGVIINEKFKSTYTSEIKAFLIMGTNKPVKITDAKSGLIRRLIDVTPSGEKIPVREYRRVVKQIEFELGAIAYHCQEVYLDDPNYYDNYIPINMLGSTNDFYNFMMDYYFEMKNSEYITLQRAYAMYKEFCADANVAYPMTRRTFGEELKNYFGEYYERLGTPDDTGMRPRSVYMGFKTKMFDSTEEDIQDEPVGDDTWIQLAQNQSTLDSVCFNCPAQYGNQNEKPSYTWDNVSTRLKDLKTDKLHYMLMDDIHHIVIDFDLKDPSGNKSLDLNIKAATEFKPTYCEVSKGGNGLHLHYFYDGDPTQLASLYSKDIEIKVFSGKQSLRRKLSLCNTLNISHLNSGLPLKEVNETISSNDILDEYVLRARIAKCLRKEYEKIPYTTQNINFIAELLDNAQRNNVSYDITDMKHDIIAFANGSTNQADACLKKVQKMKFISDNRFPTVVDSDGKLAIFDIEVYPNLFMICYKIYGPDEPVHCLINPSPNIVENICKMKLVGFNCRRYDNHLLYGRILGESNEQLYERSQRIINKERGAFFGEAYNLSYTDVYDFSSKKQSLKKFEIELGIHHQEMGIRWDEPVPESLWPLVSEYCKNDVLATEAVFNARKADFTARKILADVAGMSVNDTTNSLTTQIIFGKNRAPQTGFNYRHMGGEEGKIYNTDTVVDGVVYDYHDSYTLFDDNYKPIFPGYIFDNGRSYYRGEEVGEGGYVYAEPGIYTDVALLDIASMHPSSIVAEQLFGEYTKRFEDILNARIAIKHKDYDKAKKMLGGVLAKYLDDPQQAKDLAQALKIAINSVYGLTAAKFENPFKDIRNIDNIVAKRGALFMVNLKHMVQERGFTVAHIKTDSIKIPNATPEIIQFVTDYGKQYGYNFEHEATYEKMCLVNDAVYIAKYKDNGEDKGKWTATGAQFAVPYVFKTLFSGEPISLLDLCETKSVTSALYLDMNEDLPEDQHDYRFVGRVGSFCPIKEGCGGGLLLREQTDKATGAVKYNSATGAKGYRWLEAETITEDKKDIIDIGYFDELVRKAEDTIAEYGDVDMFTDGY